MVQIHPGVSEIWVPQSLAQVLPDLTSFWPMGKSIWCKWANNYDSAQLQVQTSPWNFKWGKSIQRFQRYAFRKVWTQFVPNLTNFWPMGKPIWGKWPWRCTTTGLDNSTELRMEKIHQAVTEIWVPQVWQPPARPAGPWRQYPSSLEGWGVKRCDRQTENTICRAAWSQLKTIGHIYICHMHHFVAIVLLDPEIGQMSLKDNRASIKYFTSVLRHALCIISKPWVNLNWSYSPKILNSSGNEQFFVPRDLEIKWMTLKNNRTPLLYNVKLCASFQSHRWIQTAATVQKCSIRVKIRDFFSHSKLFTSLWVPGTHKPRFLWVPEHWKWVPSSCLYSLEILRCVPRMQVVSSWWVPFEF